MVYGTNAIKQAAYNAQEPLARTVRELMTTKGFVCRDAHTWNGIDPHSFQITPERGSNTVTVSVGILYNWHADYVGYLKVTLRKNCGYRNSQTLSYFVVERDGKPVLKNEKAFLAKAQAFLEAANENAVRDDERDAYRAKAADAKEEGEKEIAAAGIKIPFFSHCEKKPDGRFSLSVHRDFMVKNLAELKRVIDLLNEVAQG